MKAVTWHGREDVRVDNVTDPTIQEPTDAIVRITSTAVCGSDLHLYSVLGVFMEPGDILGHEPMGVVEEVGSGVEHIGPGDRVVIPFNLACGRCFMCERQLHAQCETTQVRAFDKGAALFGYTKLYGHVPGAQAEYLRVPQAHFGPIKVPEGTPDERFLYLSDVLPTAWQAVAYADIPHGGSVAVVGLGPIGQMTARIARHQGAERVIGIDRVPERLEMARRHGIETVNFEEHDDVADYVRALTQGRGPDSVVEAVGMEAHGAPVAQTAHQIASRLPGTLAEKFIQRAGLDRLAALNMAISMVRRAGTISVIGVYGGQVDPIPMMTLFDKGVQLRMGQAHVKRWIDDIIPLLTGDGDPLGVADLATHTFPLDSAPHGYRIFQKKLDRAIKVVLKPGQAEPSPAPAEPT